MKVEIKALTNIVNSLSRMVVADKNIPGVMLRINGSELSICYSNGKYSFIRKLECVPQDNDVSGDVCVDYSLFVNAISSIQPSGLIVVDEVQFTFSSEPNIISIEAEQKCEVEEGVFKHMATKRYDIAWAIPTAEIKTSILSRMKYDDIFTAENPDKWVVSDLSDVLTRTSTEGSTLIYMSPKNQCVFVSNTANLLSYPISKNEISDVEKLGLESELDESGNADSFDEVLEQLERKMHHAAVLTTVSAKQICGVLSALNSDTEVFVSVSNGQFMSIFTQDESTGLWLTLTQGNRMHTGTFDRYNSFNYGNHQLTFVREFLVDNIKSAMNSSTSDHISLSFEKSLEDIGGVDLVTTSISSNASTSNTYRVAVDECVDRDETIVGKHVSLGAKTMYDMLQQIKTDYVAIDFQLDGDIKCVRIAEVDMDRVAEEYNSARTRLGLGDEEATPVSERIGYRSNTLGVREYAMLTA